jgi:hypothetical protein
VILGAACLYCAAMKNVGLLQNSLLNIVLTKSGGYHKGGLVHLGSGWSHVLWKTWVSLQVVGKLFLKKGGMQ